MDELIPTRLREFVGSTTLTPEDHEQVLEVRLKCPRCGGDRFVLHFAYERSQISPRDILPFDPVWVVCNHCRYYGLLYTGESDGLNGFHGCGPVKVRTDPVQPWKDAKEPEYKVIVSVVLEEQCVDKNDRFHYLAKHRCGME